MVEWSGPWNIGHGDGQFDEERTILWARSHIPDGIAAQSGSGAGNVTVLTTGTRMSRMAACSAFIHGVFYTSTAAVDIAHPTNSSTTQSRIDVVVLRASRSLGTARPAIRQGSVGGAPIAPSLVQDWDSAGIWETPLREVLVRPTVTTFVAGDLGLDRRLFIYPRSWTTAGPLTGQSPGAASKVDVGPIACDGVTEYELFGSWFGWQGATDNLVTSFLADNDVRITGATARAALLKGAGITHEGGVLVTQIIPAVGNHTFSLNFERDSGSAGTIVSPPTRLMVRQMARIPVL